MLEVQWDYLEKNIYIDNAPVAIMRPKNNPNKYILFVYDKGYHYCAVWPEYGFLKPKPVPYSVALAKLKSQYNSDSSEILSSHDALLLQLKETCKIIEEDCKKQAEKILELIS